jgi:hypothetical protein
MSWREIRAQARDLVHETFCHPAVYTAPDGVTTTNVRVRLHSRLQIFGDLDREGYARVLEEVNHVIFDSTEVVPRKNGTVNFAVDENFDPIVGLDAEYEIVNITPSAGDRYIKTGVTLK